jgi:hypothetical protein
MEPEYYWITYERPVNRALNPHIRSGKVMMEAGLRKDEFEGFDSSRVRIISVYKGTIGDMMTARQYIDHDGRDSLAYKKFLEGLERVR